MSREDKKDKTVYMVVYDPRQKRYSIWPADREGARGERDAVKTGTKQECLDYINERAREKPTR